MPDEPTKSGWDWHAIGLVVGGTILSVVIGFAGTLDTRIDNLESANDKAEAAALVEKEAADKAHAAASERDEASEKAEKARIDDRFSAIDVRMGAGMQDRYTRDHHDDFASEIRSNARERDQKIGRLDGIIEAYLASLGAGR